MIILTSPLLEVLPHLYHGFGTKTGEKPTGIIVPRQVHGDHIEIIGEPVPETWHREADAILTSVPSLAVGIRTADCLPILMADREGRGVGAVHAGWKGVALGLLPSAIRAFCSAFGVSPEEVIVAVGPGIGPCCLEVDAPVRDFFYEHGQGEGWEIFARPGREDHWWLDIKAFVQAQAIKAGVRPEGIDVLAYCTCCERDYFHSYRRDGLAAGRQVNYIVLKEPEA